MTVNLVVFSGSNKPTFYNEIEKELHFIGENLDKSKFMVFYGGGEEGIMSVLPRAFSRSGGEVCAIDWEHFVNRYGTASFGRTFTTTTFEQRQKELLSKGDIYLCLPGGVGTMSELFDVLVSNDVHKMKKKVVLFSFRNFFSDIQQFLYKKTKEGFIKPIHLQNTFVLKTPEEVLQFLNETSFS